MDFFCLCSLELSVLALRLISKYKIVKILYTVKGGPYVPRMPGHLKNHIVHYSTVSEACNDLPKLQMLSVTKKQFYI